MVSHNSNNKLVEGLNNMTTTSSLIKKQAESQLKAITCLTKWATDNDNMAIEDVIKKTFSLFEIFTDKLFQLAREQDTSIKELKKMVQTETSIKNAKKKLERSIEYEKEMEKQIKKYSSSSFSFFKAKKMTNLEILQHNLNEARSATFNASRELDDIKAEMEVIKMFRFRKGMEKLSVAWRKFANDISLIFACQQELVEMVPAIGTEDVREMIYAGASSTESMVDDLKRKLNYFNNPNNTGKITPKDSTIKKSHLIKKREFPSPLLYVTNFPKINTPIKPTYSSFGKLSNNSDYSSCNSLENYEPPIVNSTTIPPSVQGDDSGYENMYPVLPPNPYIDKQKLNDKKGFVTNLYNSTCNQTFMSNKSIKN
ncbi:Hypothetical protein SRAE_1000222800 [Strongyloides ratti]|uniref:Uncharacterized protein n=1 Tax=Strongyloides ratti TaxID=34506 RepID=A0A090L2N9_STRRB|nr:Hypothetical protein SRAE_1000222800 [Strongyloides ratti]CEF63972.1 Hypothetical protein SRAE_1000222800 [Strongyloides ratti]